MNASTTKNTKHNRKDTFQGKEKKKQGAIDFILAAILGLIVVVMFAQVIFRYAFNNSLSWSEEVVKFLFIWLSFLGASVLIRDKSHIGVDFFVDLLPGYWKKRIQLLDTLLTVCFLFFLSITGFLWLYYTRATVSSALGLPLNIVLYGALPISSLAGVAYGVINIITEIKEINKRNNKT